MNNNSQLTNNHIKRLSIDGLVIAKFSRSIFKEMQKGKITAANCTCSVWENFSQTIDNLTIWNDHFEHNSDIICNIKKYEDLKNKKIELIVVGLGYYNKGKAYGQEMRSEYNTLKKILDKKYKLDFTFTEADEVAFNSGELDILSTCYERCAVNLQITQLTDNVDVIVEYSSKLIAEAVFKLTSPNYSKPNYNKF